MLLAKPRAPAALIAASAIALAIAWALAPPTSASAQRAFRTTQGGPALVVASRARTEVQPKSVNVSPDGQRVVVCNFGRPDRDNVFVYDADTLEQVGAVGFAGNAVESAFSRDGRTLYVSNFRRNVVEEIDFASLTVRRELPVGSHPKTLSLSPDERTLYVANYFGRSVSVVDLESGREIRQLATAERPRGMGVFGDGTLLTAAFNSDVVHVFDGGASTERERWDVCRYPRDILPAPDGAAFYMTCSLGHIGFYSRPGIEGLVTSTGRARPFGVAPTGRNPRSIGVNASGRWLGVANFTSSDVSLIDTVERTHRRIEVPGASRIVGLAMHPGPEPRIYATSWDTNEVIMLALRGDSNP